MNLSLAKFSKCMYISRGTQVTTPLSIRTWPLSGYINLLLCPVQSQTKGELETLSSQYKFYYKLSTLVRIQQSIYVQCSTMLEILIFLAQSSARY